MSHFANASRDSLPKRVVARPTADLWFPDEILSLEEAIHLFWPDGPLTTRSLRTAARDGALAVVWIAGKIFTTPGAIADMTRCKLDNPGVSRASRQRSPSPPPAARPQAPPLNEATQKLLDCLAEERARLKPRLNRSR